VRYRADVPRSAAIDALTGSSVRISRSRLRESPAFTDA
jgi:hypothetical protein